MDPIDILGGILGQKSSGGGIGATILKEIFKGATQSSAPPKAQPKPQPRSGPAPSSSGTVSRAPASRPSAPRELGEDDLERQARELEDLLNVANSRNTGRTTEPQRQTPPAPSPRPAPIPTPAPRDIEVDRDGPIFRREQPQHNELQRQNEQALILVKAMVNAAKSDGQISQTEQQAILGRLDNPPPETIQFLRDEFNKPLNVRDFAWSVPLGMEQQVYSMSLLAIDLDSPREDDYLRELAHGLRMPTELCSQLQERMGVSSAARFARDRA